MSSRSQDNRHQDPTPMMPKSSNSTINTNFSPDKLPKCCSVCNLPHNALYWRYTEEEYQMHIEKKQQAQQDKATFENQNNDKSVKKVASSSSGAVVTFDEHPTNDSPKSTAATTSPVAALPIDDELNNSNNYTPLTKSEEKTHQSEKHSTSRLFPLRRRSSAMSIGSPTEAAPVHSNKFFPVAPNVDLHLFSRGEDEDENNDNDDDDGDDIAPPIERRNCYCPMCYTITFRQYPTEKHNIKGAKYLWTWTSYRAKGFCYPFSDQELTSHFGSGYLGNNSNNNASPLLPSNSMKSNSSNVFKPTLIINTGGTLSCVPDPVTGLLSPAPLYDYLVTKVEAFSPIVKNNNNTSSDGQPSKSSIIPQLIREADHLKHSPDCKIPFVLLENPHLMLDSTEASFDEWNLLAMIIVARMNFYSSFVIIHGTDTLAYSASALTFSIFGLTCPVVITGSQTPLRGVHGGNMLQGSSDATMNLLGACDFARQHTRLRGVFVYFHNKVFLGSRVVKAHSQNFDGFSAPSVGCVAFYNGTFTQNDRLLRHIDQARDHEVSALALHVQKHQQYYGKFVALAQKEQGRHDGGLALISARSSSYSTPSAPGPLGFPIGTTTTTTTTTLRRANLPSSQSCADDFNSSNNLNDVTAILNPTTQNENSNNNNDNNSACNNRRNLTITYDEIEENKELLIMAAAKSNNNNTNSNPDEPLRQHRPSSSLLLAEGCDPRSTRNPADILPFFDRRHNSAIQRFHRSAKVLVFTTRPGSTYGSSGLYDQLIAHAVDATEPVALCVLAYGAGNAQVQIRDTLRWVREHCNVPVCFSSQCFAGASSSHYSVGLQREHGVNVYDMTFCAVYTRLLLVISQHIFIQCMDQETRQVDISKFRRSRAFRDCVEDWMAYNHRVSFTPQEDGVCEIFGTNLIKDEDFNVVRDSSVAMYSS